MTEYSKEAQNLFKYRDGKEYKQIKDFIWKLLKEIESLKKELKNAQKPTLFG